MYFVIQISCAVYLYNILICFLIRISYLVLLLLMFLIILIPDF